MANLAEFPTPPANADVDTYWAFIEDMLDHIMIKLRPNLSLTMYMNLYNVCYSYNHNARLKDHSIAILQKRLSFHFLAAFC